jgi:hydrophobic/amphiphilic exporter-1 (mainly G- bacteria), HAE1 family
MGLTRLAVQRPLVIAMVFAALLLLGWRARSRLPTELNPRVDIPSLTITVALAGAGPAEVERRVTIPIEDAVSTVSNVDGLFSSSQENVCYVVVDFAIGTNLDAAMADVRARLDAARGDLPEGASAPVTTKLDLNAEPVMVLGLTGPRSLTALRTLADERVKTALSQVPGVASVQVVGGDVSEVQLRVDARRLDAASLSLEDVVNALRAASQAAPAGTLMTPTVSGYPGRELTVRVNGEFQSLDDIRRTPVGGGPALPGAANGPPTPASSGSPAAAPLLLQDMATVTFAPRKKEEITRVNGRESIGLIVNRSPDANTVAVAAGVRRALRDLQAQAAGGSAPETRPPDTWQLQDDAEVTVLRDQSTGVKDALDDINGSLILGALLAVGVVWLFLRNFRDTVIIALAIPCSLIPTFLVMYLGGFTLNQMTMLGLSLSIGILVDDSIVVLENIHRHLARGESPREAAINGRSEIGLAAVTITMADVVVFLPIAFMGGVVGQFFRQFGLTVATATLLSLYVSFSITPMLAAHWGRREGSGARGQGSGVGMGGASLTPDPRPLTPGAFERAFVWLEEWYRRALAWALRHRWAVVATGFGSLAVSLLAAALVLGVDFVPPSDRGQVTATVELPPGSPLAATDATVQRVDAAAAATPEVRARLASAGEIPAGFGSVPRRGSEVGQVALTLQDKPGLLDWLLHPWNPAGRHRSDEEVAAELRRLVGHIPGAHVTVTAVRAWGGGSAPLQAELSGADLNQLTQIARRVEATLATVAGVRQPDISLRTGRPELHGDLDRTRAAALGVSEAEVVAALRDAVQGNTDVKYRQGDHTFDVRVSMAGLQEAGPETLGALPVGHSSGAPIMLAEVATLRQDVGPTEITRTDRQRVVTVSAELAPDAPLGNVQRAAARAIERLPHPGVEIHWGGEVNEMDRSAGLLISALLLAAALTYMLMAALFNSLIHPLTIMLCLPMALVGAIATLAIASETLNVVSMIGIIMLVGLVAKNAILLVDYTNTLRSRGLERDAAVQQAGPVRLRPIAMTTLAMVLGMLPVALRIGRSAEMRAPMAIAVIGGLILSTLLTLLVIPVVYTLFDDLQSRREMADPVQP